MGDNNLASKIAGQDTEEREINIRDYLLVVIKRRWMILTILVLVVIIAAIYTFLQKPQYRTSVTMYINRINYNIVPEVVTDTSHWMGYEAFFQTEYKLLRSKTLARRVVGRLNLLPIDLIPVKDRPKNYRPPSTPKEKDDLLNASAGAVLGMVSIAPIKGTFLCEISFTSFDPKLSMQLANAWADEYINFSLESQYEYTQTAEDLITSQVTTLQKEIGEKEKLLQDYSLEKKVVKLDNDRSMSAHMLEELNSALTLAVQDRISREVRYREIQSFTSHVLPEVSTNEMIQQLKSEYASLEQQYTEKAKTYKPEYPEMIRIRSQMDQIQQRMTQESKEIYQKTLAAARADYLEASGKEAALKQQMEDSKKSSIDENRKEFDYDRLKVELDNKRQLMDSLLKKQSETGVSVQVKEKKATTIRIVDRAELPAGAFSPDVRRNIMFSVMFGLIAGIGCAFVLEYLDRSLKNADDVERFVQLPFLGMVPRYEAELDDQSPTKAVVRAEQTHHSESQATDLLTLYNPSSIASEAFRTVRTSLLLSFPEAPPRTILVTSSRPGEGKTFVACNLAISLAQLDKKVVLIDADMRNPRVHRIWKMNNEVGLSRYLTSDVKAIDVTRPSLFDGLSIITSGTKTPRPAELLSSKRLDHLIEELQQTYDHVIIDSPPVMPVADSLILAAKSESVVFVIHGGVTPRDVVQMARQKLGKSEANLAGAVLNHINMTDPYYYYSYYSNYGYRYGEQAKQPKFLQ